MLQYAPRPSARLPTAALVALLVACVPGCRGQDGPRDTTAAAPQANDTSAVAPGPPPRDPLPTARQPSSATTGATAASSPGQAAEPSTAAAPAPAKACGRKTCGEGESCFLMKEGPGTPMAAPTVISAFECRRRPPQHDHGYFCTPTKHGYTICNYLAPVQRPQQVTSSPAPSL